MDHAYLVRILFRKPIIENLQCSEPFIINFAFDRYFLLAQCWLSKITFIDNINSYTHMNDINIILSFVSLVLICLIQSLLRNVSFSHLKNPYQWFCWGRRIFVPFPSPSLLNQVARATVCPPVQTSYDPPHISTFSVHLFNFFVCTGFSFFLGMKFTSVRPEHRWSTSWYGLQAYIWCKSNLRIIIVIDQRRYDNKTSSMHTPMNNCKYQLCSYNN